MVGIKSDLIKLNPLKSDPSINPKIPKKRVKTGCFNCRKKHKKCDEQKPTCNRCIKRMETCVWPDSRARPLGPHRYQNQSQPDFEIKDSTSTTSSLVSPGLTSILSHELITSSTSPIADANTPTNAKIQLGVLETTGANMELGTIIPDNRKSTQPNFEIDNSTVIEHANPVPESAPHMDEISDPGSPFSPESLMTSYLNFTSLHRTFRDFMFTASGTQEASPQTDLTYRNILESPPPAFMAQAHSYTNLQALLNDQNMAHGVQDTFTESNITLTEKERLVLFKTFLYEVAPWLDMFDATKQFGTAVPNLATQNKVVLDSIYALALRQQEQLREETPSQKTIAFYQESLRGLIPTVNQTLDISIIVSCVLLCVFDMMSSPPTNWRHQLEGCAALLRGRSINGFSSSKLERAIFWCYARMDVNAAIVSEKPTMIPSEKWISDGKLICDARELFTAENSDDMYANYMVFICSRVVNLIASPHSDYLNGWKYLWEEVSDWYLNRPAHMKEIKEMDEKPFPGILFLNGPAISANQMFHMAVILLIQNRPRMYKIEHKEHMRSRIWHAKEICGISLHNEHHGCWNNAVQPLGIAGRLLSSELEHRTILELLEKIEATTGWQMKFISQKLKAFWYD